MACLMGKGAHRWGVWGRLGGWGMTCSLLSPLCPAMPVSASHLLFPAYSLSSPPHPHSSWSPPLPSTAVLVLPALVWSGWELELLLTFTEEQHCSLGGRWWWQARCRGQAVGLGTGWVVRGKKASCSGEQEGDQAQARAVGRGAGTGIEGMWQGDTWQGRGDTRIGKGQRQSLTRGEDRHGRTRSREEAGMARGRGARGGGLASWPLLLLSPPQQCGEGVQI